MKIDKKKYIVSDQSRT